MREQRLASHGGGRRRDRLDQLLEPLADGPELAGLEIRKRGVQAEARRGPAVLLDSPARGGGELSTVVVQPGQVHDQGMTEGRDPRRLGECRLRVGDP
jgi:hypothetical protein